MAILPSQVMQVDILIMYKQLASSHAVLHKLAWLDGGLK